MSVDATDVAVVGAGPAGFTLARQLAAAGLRVTVLDEQSRAGGQVLRQPPAQFTVERWLPGRVYRGLIRGLREAESAPGIEWWPGTTVWGIFRNTAAPGFEVRVHDATQARRLQARRVVIAAGCHDMPVAFPGWQLPFVMTAGGMQTLLKSQRLAAGSRVALVGSHPLQLVLADQLLDAGVDIACVAFSQSWTKVFTLLRSPTTILSGFGYLLDTLGVLIRLRARGVPLLFGTRLERAIGETRVEAVKLTGTTAGASKRMLDCDALATCYGFHPSTELARQAGADSHWSASGGWAVRTDGAGRTAVPDLFVAGEQTGVKGARAAIAEAEIVASSVIGDAGLPVDQRNLIAARRRYARVALFAATLAEVSAASDPMLDAMADAETLLCRCEDVSRRALEEAIRLNPLIRSASSLKMLTRVGMGLCQGRLCESAVRRCLRAAGVPDAGFYVPRAPVKPVPAILLAQESGTGTVNPREIEDRIGCEAPGGHHEDNQ